MNRQNKIILMILLIAVALALTVSLYLVPQEKQAAADRSGPISGPSIQPPTSAGDPVQPLPKDAAAPTVAANQADGMTSPPAAAAFETNPYVSYPDALLDLLEIDMNDLLENRDAFRSTIIHVEWMDRVNAILKNLDPEKRAAIIKNQTTLLYLKDKLNEAYLLGEIDHATFIKALADLMKWHQKTYESMLNHEQYLALFDIAPEHVEDTIDAMFEDAPEYSFILNQGLPTHEVTQRVQGYKLEEVNSHFKRMILDREHIGKKINTGELTLDQAREALQKSQQAFIAKCKEILTIDEINTIFGSMEALETGTTQTEAPPVVGNEDLEQLGFRIENPATGVDLVKEKISADKREDIRFFYQERDAERAKLIEKLDAGEISSDEVENISREMDAAFEENCRSILTEEEYQLVFDTSPDITADAAPEPEIKNKTDNPEQDRETSSED